MSENTHSLKPCPFCGGEAEIERYGTSRVSTICQCQDCGASLESGEEWGHGRDWNTRPNEDSLAATIASQESRIEALREALKPFAQVAALNTHAETGASVLINIERCREAALAAKEGEA